MQLNQAHQAPPVDVPPPQPPAVQRWYSKFKILLFVVFAFEIGFFLIVFPWLGGWERTSIPAMLPWLSPFWENPFFKGAVSGLGLVNVYISLLKFTRLRR